MQIFENTITVTESDLDALNHVNNVRYVQWVQDIAEQHWSNKASDNILESYFWVMLSHCISYKNPAFLNNTLILRTYVTKSEGVTSTRIVEILNSETQKLLAKSETTWCFMATKTMRPTRISEAVSNLFC